MSDIYKATKNKVVDTAFEKPDVYKATSNKQVDPQISIKNKTRTFALNSMPFPSGTITPSKMKTHIQQNLGSGINKPPVHPIINDDYKQFRYDSLKLDTLGADISKAGNAVKTAYSGWQDKKSMESLKPTIENAYNRLKMLDSYNADYGDGSVDVSEQLKAYKSILDEWDEIAETYGKYDSADKYNKAQAESNAYIEKMKKMESVNLETLGAEVEAWEKERNKIIDNKEWLNKGDWRNDENGTPAIPYSATSIPAFVGKNIMEMQEMVAKKKELYNLAKRHQDLQKLSSVLDKASENYDKNASKYIKKGKETDFHKVGKEHTSDYVNEEGVNTGTTYIVDDLRAAAIALAEHNGTPKTETNGDNYRNVKKYRHLKENEFEVFAYYLGKDMETGGNQAREYLDMMDETLKTRMGTETYEKYLKDNSLLETLYAVPVGLDQFANGVTNLFNTKDDYIPVSSTQVAGQLAREDLSDAGFKLPKWLGGSSFGQGVYDVLSTTANMAPSILVSAVANYVVPGSGAYVGGTLMGASAAGNAYQEALNNGMDKSQARTYSSLVGVSEAALSALLSKAMGGKALEGKLKDAINGIDNKLLKFAANYGTAFVSEGAEEGLQEILTPIFENIALGYNKNGFEDIDWGEVAYSALLGGLSGGNFEVIGSVANRVKGVNYVKKTYNTGDKVLNLLNLGLSLPQDSNAQKLAQKYNESSKKNGKISANKVYNLLLATENYVSDKLTQLGESGNVAVVSSAVVKKLSGVELSVSEIELLSKSTHGQEVLNTIVPKAESTPSTETIADSQNSQLQSQGDGVLKENSGAIEADTEVPADFMPESEGTPSADAESGTLGDAKNLLYEKKLPRRKHTTATEQDFIKRIANALGLKLEFTHITADLLRSYGYDFKDGDILPDGYFDNETNTIHIGYTVYNPVAFIFKHELTHFGEGTAQYNNFVKAVKKSKTFKNWLQKETGRKKATNVEDAYILKIARERGYIKNENGALTQEERDELHCEMIADFVGKCIFNEDSTMLDSMLSDLDYKERNAVIQYILDFLSYLKKKLAGNKDIIFEISRLEDNFNRMISETVEAKKETPTENGRDLQFSIVNLDSGKSYVQASRKIIKGNSVAEWRLQISKFFNNALKNGPIKIRTIEGDVLTINKETAKKARDKHISENGITRELTDNEFRVKLEAESHIDELSEISISNKDYFGDKKITSDRKNHNIAKEGFSYRTVYFKDFDKNYYRITLSVGESNNISTVYNVGKIKVEDIPNGNIVSAIGSKADMSSTNDSISNNSPIVNENSKNKLQFSFARVQDETLIAKAEKMETKLIGEGKGSDITKIRIWNKFGIIRDAAGQWIYEIDDSSMKFIPFEGPITENPELLELYALERSKYLSKSQEDRRDILRNKYKYIILESGKLKDFIKHTTLFKAFPQLKEINFSVCVLEGDNSAYYDKQNNTIGIDWKKIVDIQKLESGENRIKDFPENPYDSIRESIIHEIQHALQEYENREPGASSEYWIRRFTRDNISPEAYGTDMKTLARDAYQRTKGEVEARVTSERLNMTEEERRKNMPWFSWNETISAKEPALAKNFEKQAHNDVMYMSAVENGNTKALQEMVDSAAASKGYTERLYHQTGADFTEFNTENELAGKYDWELPTGVFLKPSNNDIGLKGKKQMELFARLKNPLLFKDRAEARTFWAENIEGYKVAANKVFEIDSEYQRKHDEAIDNTRRYLKKWRRENPGVDSREIYKDSKYLELNDIEDNIADEWEAENDKVSIKAKRLINDFMAESGYDGIVLDQDQGSRNRQTKSYIVFSPEQLKSAAPVVYDNSGNVIPLSERFNQNKKDIRFSMPSETAELLDMYESGEITKAQYQAAMDKYWDNAIAEVEGTAWSQQYELLRRNVNLKKRIKRQNEQLARRRSEISQEITIQREERASKQKNIEHIRKTVSSIDKMLRTNTENKHVPEELKEEIKRFVGVFVQNDRSPFNKKDFRNIYLTYSDALRESSLEESNSSLDDDVLQDIKTLRERLDGKTLRDLNYHETLLVRNIVDNFAQIIKWANEMFIAGKEVQLHEVGRTAISELVRKSSKIENPLTKAVDNAIIYNNMTPAYFFDNVGGVFKILFDDIVESQNKWFRNAENGKTYIRQIKEKYHYSDWKNDKLKFTTEYGDDIEITREQAMLLYATAKREYGNEFQKAEHLFRGGVVIEPTGKKLDDVVKKFKASDEKGRKRIAEAFSEEVDSRAHRITPDDMLKIKFWLTDEQLEYVDAFVDYLSNDMAALGNEISMQLYGIRKYNEKYYIPYNSAQNFLYSQPGVNNESRLKHQSFTKNTVVGANNPLILSDFSTVCADHINRMCMYNAMTMPLENMNKIFNYKKSGENIDTMSVRAELERVYGKAAVSYIKTFIEDMNGNVRVSNTDKAINRWISKFKKGAVFASASVVVQQPSAIIRAMAYIEPKYFRQTTLKFSERDYQQCVQYAPVAGIKEMGRFDTGVGLATTNWLLQETPKGFKNKVRALLDMNDSTYRDEKMSYFAAKADEITWAHIWAAVKAEIADKTDLRVGGRQYFEACGKRFTEVINYTQVYDSTISRSQMMRSKSTGAQMLTAFMSEPTVSLNLLMNAAREAKTGTKEGKQYAKRAVAAFVGSVLLNSLLKSFVTAARDDEEDKTYLEKYVGNFAQNFVSDVNPLGLIPFVKDVISVFEGYTVERADMNLFSDLAQSIKTLNSETKTDYEKVESVLGSLAAFLGLPVKNVLRDGRAVYNLYNDFFVNKNKTDWQGVKFAVFGDSNADKYKALVKAAENDDEAEYQKIYKHLIDSGKNESDIKSGLKNIYRKDSDVKKTAKEYIEDLSKNETFTSLDKEDQDKLQKDITSVLVSEKTVKAMNRKVDRFDELYEAYRTNKPKYEKLKKELLSGGLSESLISDGLEMARIAYMKSIGVDVSEYLLYKIAKSKKYADTDKSGGVSEAERKKAVKEMDIDEKIKNYFINQHK